MRLHCLFLTIAFCCLTSGGYAANRVSAPRIGMVRYGNGSMYPLYGIAENYVLGPRFLDGVDALSFSENGGILVRRGQLMLIDNSLRTLDSFETGSDTPVVSIDKDLSSALAWLPAHQMLVYSNGSAFQSITVVDGDWSGQVIGLERSTPEVASVLLRNNQTASMEEVRVSLKNGSVLSLGDLSDAPSSIFRDSNLLLSFQPGKLSITSISSGSLKSVPIQAQDITVERLSNTTIHLHSPASGRDWLLHVDREQPILSELPPPPSGGSQ